MGTRPIGLEDLHVRLVALEDAPAPPAGISASFLGYNVIGASVEAMTNFRVYLKKIVIPSEGILASIGAYLRNDAGNNVNAINVGLFADNAGAPGLLLAPNAAPSVILQSALNTPVARWLDIPIQAYIEAAGDYWMGIQVNSAGPGSINYDAGDDQHYTSNFGGFWDGGGGSFGALTVSARKYSMRGVFTPIV